jgi:ABC-2 type transport system permease protein
VSLAIEAHHLTKRFPPARSLRPGKLLSRRDGGTLALDDVSLTVGRGEIFGLVGPNGAGKTTLVKILSTLVLPTAGTARVNGYDLDQEMAIKRTIGLMTGNERHFYWRLSGRENLHFYAGLQGLREEKIEKRVAELAGLLGLEDYLDKRFDAYSTGMKHRLALATSLIHDPVLLFLDEPTRSLDPLAAARFRQVVYELARAEQRTIFLVTHDLDEAVELCDRAAVMVEGRLRVVGPPENLRSLLRPRDRVSLYVQDSSPSVEERVRGMETVLDVEARRAGATTVLTLRMPNAKVSLPSAIAVMEAEGAHVERVEYQEVSWAGIFDEVPEEGAALNPQPPTPTPQPPVPRSRPPIPNLRTPWAFLKRDFLTETSYRLSFVLQFLGMLFSASTFYFIAQLFGPGAAPYLQEYQGNYFAFVLVGIAFTGYQSVALHAFSGVIRSGQVAGTLEALLVTPTPISTILLSSSLWNFLFTSVRVAIYLLLGVLVFGVDLGEANVLSALLILGLTVLAVSSVGILSASFIIVLKRGDPVNFVFSSLSSLLAGVYYPIEVLPTWLRWLGRFFPLTYALQAMRRALLNGATILDLWREALALVAFAALLLPVSLWAFRRALRIAKRDGSLMQY